MTFHVLRPAVSAQRTGTGGPLRLLPLTPANGAGRADTPNRAAASRHDAPAAIAPNTRSRRSIDSTLLIPPGLHTRSKG